ncbi:MAG: hypothetical protein ACP5G8_07070 [Athalassotoga sp.]
MKLECVKDLEVNKIIAALKWDDILPKEEYINLIEKIKTQKHIDDLTITLQRIMTQGRSGSYVFQVIMNYTNQMKKEEKICMLKIGSQSSIKREYENYKSFENANPKFCKEHIPTFVFSPIEVKGYHGQALSVMASEIAGHSLIDCHNIMKFEDHKERQKAFSYISELLWSMNEESNITGNANVFDILHSWIETGDEWWNENRWRLLDLMIERLSSSRGDFKKKVDEFQWLTINNNTVLPNPVYLYRHRIDDMSMNIGYGMMHGDFHPDNVLVKRENDKYRIFLIDLSNFKEKAPLFFDNAYFELTYLVKNNPKIGEILRVEDINNLAKRLYDAFDGNRKENESMSILSDISVLGEGRGKLGRKWRSSGAFDDLRKQYLLACVGAGLKISTNFTFIENIGTHDLSWQYFSFIWSASNLKLFLELSENEETIKAENVLAFNSPQRMEKRKLQIQDSHYWSTQDNLVLESWSKDCDFENTFPSVILKSDLDEQFWKPKHFEMVLIDNPKDLTISKTLQIDITNAIHGIYNNKGINFIAGRFEDKSSFPYLWVSGGYMLILKMNGKDWLLLLFDYDGPVGWNIPSKFSSTLDELEQIDRLTFRALAENVIFFKENPDGKYEVEKYILRSKEGAVIQTNSVSIQMLLRYTQNRMRIKSSEMDIHLQDIETPFEVRVKSGEKENLFKNVVFFINRKSKIIEIVSVARTNLTDGAYLLDGALSGDLNHLLRRPIVLMNMDFLKEQFSQKRVKNIEPDEIRDLEPKEIEELKITDPVPKEKYIPFTWDIEYIQNEFKKYRFTENKYKTKIMDSFANLANHDDLEDPALRILKPAVWKTLEILFNLELPENS